jgi:hypothetical protein
MNGGRDIEARKNVKKMQEALEEHMNIKQKTV